MTVTSSERMLETLIARTIGEEPVLSMSSLKAAPIPSGVIRYMHAEIFNRLAEDLSRAPHFARVASPMAGPDAVRDALLTHAAGQYIFPRAEFLEMLENATRFTENYLCRPRWTLSSFLFLDQSAITTETLLRKLEYVTDYAYLPQLLRRLVTQSGKQVLTSTEGLAYIARIDDAVIREHSAREQALLAKPIFQFFMLSQNIENAPIPLRALLLFYEDKHMTPLRDYLEGVWHVRGKTEITLEEFIGVCEDFSSGDRTPSQPEEGETPPQTTSQEESAQVEPPQAEEPMPALPAPEPVQETLPFEEASPFEPDLELSVPGIEPDYPTSAAETIPEDLQAEPPVQRPSQDQEPLPEPTRIEDETPAEPPQQSTTPPLPPLTSMIPPDLRRRFINVICGKDAEFYELVIARLDEMRSWPDASAYIRELFEINSIDPFNDIAVAFTDLIQKRCEYPPKG
jgi:hypothetical protein